LHTSRNIKKVPTIAINNENTRTEVQIHKIDMLCSTVGTNPFNNNLTTSLSNEHSKNIIRCIPIDEDVSSFRHFNVDGIPFIDE
jgi:hypothetical protein